MRPPSYGKVKCLLIYIMFALFRFSESQIYLFVLKNANAREGGDVVEAGCGVRAWR